MFAPWSLPVHQCLPHSILELTGAQKDPDSAMGQEGKERRAKPQHSRGPKPSPCVRLPHRPCFSSHHSAPSGCIFLGKDEGALLSYMFFSSAGFLHAIPVKQELSRMCLIITNGEVLRKTFRRRGCFFTEAGGQETSCKAVHSRQETKPWKETRSWVSEESGGLHELKRRKDSACAYACTCICVYVNPYVCLCMSACMSMCVFLCM